MSHLGAGEDLPAEGDGLALGPEHLVAVGERSEAVVEAQLRLDQRAQSDVRAEEGQEVGRLLPHRELAVGRVEHGAFT